MNLIVNLNEAQNKKVSILHATAQSAHPATALLHVEPAPLFLGQDAGPRRCAGLFGGFLELLEQFLGQDHVSAP